MATTIKSKRHQDHPAVEYDGKTFCGDSWCGGQCGLPALVVAYESEGSAWEVRARGSHVACGPVFAGFRVPWTGPKIHVSENEDKAALLKLMWW